MKKLDARIRTTELDELSDALLKLYSNETALQTESFLTPLFAEMAGVSEKITEAIRQDKIYSELEDADTLRDDYAIKIFRITEGYAAMPVPALSEAAGRVSKILQKFSGLARKSYNEETSLIESMLNDLSGNEISADLNALAGVPETIALLRHAQTDFMNKRVRYNTTSSEHKYDDSASDLKKPLLGLINDRLLPYVTLMKAQNKDTYRHFTDAVENAVETANMKIHARSKKAEKKPEKL